MFALSRILVFFAFLAAGVPAFAPMMSSPKAASTTGLSAIPQAWKDKAAVASAALVTANLPVWVAFALEDDDYEYGAVDAPPLVPIIGGVLAIATALLPIALKPGEEAFEEIRERESATFGSKDNRNVLDKRK